jgi:hypothetical protein
MKLLRLLGILLLCMLPILAQNTGRISGLVTDASGAAVPGASVKLFIPGGSAPVMASKTSNEGAYYFPGVQPVSYDIFVEAKGFRTEVVRGIKVNAGVELSMKTFKLEVATKSEIVEVAADANTVQTNNAEVASTISNEQVRQLPTLDRSPLGLLTTQAGVSSNARSSTTINGLRPSYTNITIDGINIQDNFIRTNALDFLPNMLLMDQVAEFTVATSNTNAADGNGAAQVKFVTPSGTNTTHGSLYWYNRNNVMAANTWFNNKNRVGKPFLNQNQLGGTLGGHIIKDKLFYYGNYEALRLRQSTPYTRTILTSDARNGIMSYRSGSDIKKVNVLTAAGATMDSAVKSLIDQIPDASHINSTDVGDGLNTAGYSFNVRNNRTRDNVTGKADYVLSTKNMFTGTFMWNRDVVDRPDVTGASDYSTVPKVSNNNATKLVSGTWRWLPRSSMTNELRGGLNLAPAVFDTTQKFGSWLAVLPLVNNPVNSFRAQGRKTNTYNLSDNFNWFKGKHSFSFGASWQKVNADPYNDAGITPTYTLGLSANNTHGLVGSQLAGASSSDLSTANSLLALDAGYISQYAQTFNVKDKTSGYVNGYTNLRRLRLQDTSMYAADTWRVSPRLTVTYGVRWEYWTPVSEADKLFLVPQLNGSVRNTLLSNSTLNFATGNYYKRDLNNFAPNIGVAWQPFHDNGKTVFRAGYSVNYPNDEFMASVRNSLTSNDGLSSNAIKSGLTDVLSSPTPVTTPSYKVPRTFYDNYSNISTTSAFAMPDPDLVTPYVQQWNFSVQREVAKGILEVRYIGNHATKQVRAYDFNQIMVKEADMPGYMSSFKAAKNNGNLARNATGTFDPRYNSAIAGSQPVPFLTSLPGAGYLTNSSVRSYIDTNQAGELAYFYQYNQVNDASFFRNPYAAGTNVLSNISSANYHALQIDYRRTMSHGFQVQGNYTRGKSLSDSAGDSQTRFEAFLDNDNGRLEYGPTVFDQRNVVHLNGVWDLPFGKNRPFNINNPVLDHVFGGWSTSGFMTWTSGAPFTILSGRGTLNRASRSAINTASATADASTLRDAMGVTMTGNGPYFINPSHINTDGRGTATDSATSTFSGQLFYQPGAGQLGNLQRRMFYGPNYWNLDFAVLKRIVIHERQSLEFRMESTNFTNHPSFDFSDYVSTSQTTVTSTTFGKITSTQSGRRVIQFGLYFKF